MIKVFIVVPIRVHRDGLSTSLNEVEGMTVVGAAATLREALPRIRDLQPDVALVDTPEPGDIVTDIVSSAEPRLLALGIGEHDALAWVEAGVVGYVPPDASIHDVSVAVARVARGESLISSEVTLQLSSRVRRVAIHAPSAIRDGRLTHREQEVLELIAEGLPNKLIGRRLFIQEQTVKNHVHKILFKLDVRRRSEAAALVLKSRSQSR